MASVKFYLDKRTQKKDGSYPLKLTVTHKKPFHISLNVSVHEKNWINNRIEGNIPNRKFLNSYLQTQLSNVQNTILKLSLDGILINMSHTDLKNVITTGLSHDNNENDNKVSLFVDHANNFIDSREAQGTKETYLYTLSTIAKHYDISTLSFDDIDVVWLEDFNNKLRLTCKINTRSIHLRNVRAIFRDATRKKIVSKELYPFDDFSIKTEETQFRDLKPDQIKLLRDYDVEPHQEQYRDLFMLLFYLIGINTVDLLHLEKLDGDRITFKRAKTGRLYSIKVEPEAMKIIKKYSPGKKYLLNFLDNYIDYKDFRSRFNKNLKEIGPWEWVNAVSINGRKVQKKKIKPIFPKLSSYYARHSWGSIAAFLDIPDRTIKMGLGHGKKTVTDKYINFDMRKVDAANRKIIDFINSL